MMSIIDTYQELYKNATTDNQVSGIFRTLEYRSTLSEILELATWIGGQSKDRNWHEAEEYWSQSFQTRLASIEANHQRDWESVWHRDAFHRYSRDTTSKRLLLVCFADRFGWMLLPSWIFLSHLPQAITDVLIIQSKTPLHQKDFVRFQEVWEETFKVVDEICGEGNIHEVRTLGTSGGCVAATLFAANYAVKGLTLVGSPSLSNKNLRRVNADAAAILKSKASVKNVHATFIFGLGDRLAMRQIPRFLRLFPQRRIKVFPKSGHNVFSSTVRRGELSKVLQWLI
jgi:hypothetical protein